MTEPATYKQVEFLKKLCARNKIAVPQNLPEMTKQDAKVLIDELIEGEQKPVEAQPKQEWKYEQTAKATNKPNGNGSMYASYAKDIFCASVVPAKPKDFEEAQQVMEGAIKLVKQAKEAFE